MTSPTIQANKRHVLLPVRGRAVFFSALLLLILLLGGFTWLLFQPSQAKGSDGGVSIGQVAQDFTLSDTTGRLVKLSDLRGHPVMINFWASYCLPCRGETPLLEKFYQEHQAQGLVLLGIDEGEPLETILQYQQEYGITFPLLLDRSLQFGNTSTGLLGYPLPRTYFIDKNDVVRANVVGALTPPKLQEEYQTISG